MRRGNKGQQGRGNKECITKTVSFLFFYISIRIKDTILCFICALKISRTLCKTFLKPNLDVMMAHNREEKFEEKHGEKTKEQWQGSEKLISSHTPQRLYQIM